MFTEAVSISIFLALVGSVTGQLEFSVQKEFVGGGNNAIYDYKPSTELRKALPIHLMGFDREGRAVFLVEQGKWNIGKVLREYQGRLDLVFSFLEQGMQFFTDMSLKQRRSTNGTLFGPWGSAFIVDLRGSTNDFLAPGAVGFYTEMLGLGNRSAKNNAYTILINASRRDQLFHRYIIRPLIPGHTKKLFIYGVEPEKYIPAILKKISKDQLPPQLGGYSNFTYIAPYGQHFNYRL